MPAPLRLLTGFAGLVLFVMMALMLVDVIGRKAFNKPLLGAVEMVELCLLVSVYASIPLVSASAHHVRIELLDAWVPERLQVWRARLSDVVCGGLLWGAAWLALGSALKSRAAEDATSLLRIPYWPFFLAVAVLLAVDGCVHWWRLRGSTGAAA